MLVNRNDIELYIPQRKPMVMIHTLESADQKTAVTTLTVEANNIFLDGDVLGEPALAENIAQTAAAQVGYVCMQEAKPVPIGYIAAIKDFVVYALPGVNVQLRTSIEVINNVMDITLVRGTIYQNEVMICECEMRIFVKQN